MLSGPADQPSWASWTIAAGLAVSIVALVGLGDTSPSVAARAAFTVIPLAVIVAVVVVAVGVVAARDAFVLAGMLLAVAPSVAASIAAGQSIALVSVAGLLVGVAVAGSKFSLLDPGVRTLTGCSALVALAAAWIVVTPARTGPAPGWGDVAAQTGESLRRTIVGVGADGRTIALVALLIWVLAAGLLVGAAMLSDRPWLAAVVPAAVLAAMLGTWSIERWRGPVEAGSAMWIVGLAVGFTAASLARHPSPVPHVGRALVVLATWVLGLGVAHHVRRAGGSDLRLIGGLIAATITGSAAWWATSVSSMHHDGERT